MIENDKDAILENLRGVITIRNFLDSKTIIERIFWVSLVIVGTLWAGWFVYYLSKEYAANQSITVKINAKLADVGNPAITVCTEGVAKYAIAERLGNYLDSTEDLPKPLKSLRATLLKCAFREEATLNAIKAQKHIQLPCGTNELDYDFVDETCEVSHVTTLDVDSLL